MFDLVKKVIKKLSKFADGLFYIKTFSFEKKIGLFPETEIMWRVRVKQKFSENLGHNILELSNILEKFRFTTSKAVLDI